MEKKYFVLHLLPCRPDFAQTMSDEERSIMMKHVAYWTVLMKKGGVVVFGPVFDPKATYGLGIVCVDNIAELEEFIANDPAATINRYEYFPMMAMVPDPQ
ncbi:MAG TPA: YciI family protein [Panacibacter sp.]|nr:YciI family protein [Panacibacter sp.]HNP43420.1 YciI family protein [Panacibacter sp.]